MIDDGATFGIPAAQVLREVTFIHELKVEMDARLVFETSAETVELPPPDSPFQIPASVRRSLELDAAS